MHHQIPENKETNFVNKILLKIQNINLTINQSKQKNSEYNLFSLEKWIGYMF